MCEDPSLWVSNGHGGSIATSELIAPDGAKRREVGEACAIDETQEQPADVRGEELLWRQAAGLARTANARAEDENGLACDDRRYQIRNEFGRIAAVAVDEEENVGVIARRGYACLDRATIAAPLFDDDACASGLCSLYRTIARAAVDDDDFVDILRQHGGDDPPDCRLLVEARNDC